MKLTKSLRFFEFFFFALALISFSYKSLSFTGYVTALQMPVINFSWFFPAFFLALSLVLITTRKGIESVVMIPTGTLDADDERTRGAVKDYRENSPEEVLIVGLIDKDEHGRAKPTAQPIKIYKKLRKSGVKREDIFFEGESKDSLQNFVYSLEQLKDSNLRSLKISTDKWQFKRFQYYLDRAKQEGLANKDLQLQWVDSGPVRPSLPYAIAAYYKDMGRIKQAGSLKNAADVGKTSKSNNLYLILRGILGV